ncbi:sensor domain-containing protein [Paenibacillus sp. SC116]|uniref:sensor domain-containing protein n=1 Tax=Paenibacillus sp. SC116 TaxID=2968986 RepID=UPI00215A2709|nr:sensor domain-containing protein [Paenibacillus sp. SC116]MCR8846336.1 sensor domain-containing protein [Paenibacillus sp. SC116]
MKEHFIRNLKHAQLMLYTFVSGLFYFIFFSVGVTLGVGLSITVVGIPILVYVLQTAPKFVRLDARIIEKYTSLPLTQLPCDEEHFHYNEPKQDSWEQMRGTLTNRGYWIMIRLLLYKLVIGMGSLILSVLMYVTPLMLLPAPLLYKILPYNVLANSIETLPAALAVSALACLWLIVSTRVGNAFAKYLVDYTRRMIEVGYLYKTKQ